MSRAILNRIWISTAPDILGSGRVDMLTHPVAAARGNGLQRKRRVKLTHMYLKRGSVGASALFLLLRRRIDKKKKKNAHTYVHTHLPPIFKSTRARHRHLHSNEWYHTPSSERRIGSHAFIMCAKDIFPPPFQLFQLAATPGFDVNHIPKELEPTRPMQTLKMTHFFFVFSLICCCCFRSTTAAVKRLGSHGTTAALQNLFPFCVWVREPACVCASHCRILQQ